MELPTAEQIAQDESKPRPLPLEPWVAVYLGRLWKQVEAQLRGSTAAGTLVPPRTDQSTPASAHNRS